MDGSSTGDVGHRAPYEFQRVYTGKIPANQASENRLA